MRTIERPGRARTLATLATGLLLANLAHAQGATAEQHAKAAAVRGRFANLLRGGSLRPHWLPDGELWFETAAGDARDGAALVLVDPSAADSQGQAARRTLFTGRQLADALEQPRPLQVARLARSVGGGADPDDVHVLVRGNLGVVRWSAKTGAARRVSADAEPTFLLRPVPSGRRPRSQSDDTRSAIWFRNRRDEPLRLQWSDFSGELQDYGEVPAGGSLWRTTFATHVWQLSGPDGTVVAVYAAGREPGVAVLDTDGPVTPPRRDNTNRRPNRRERSRVSRRRRTPTRNATPPAWRPRFQGGNLWLTPERGGDSVQVTTDGTSSDPYTGPVHWSGDGKHLMCLRVAAAEAHPVHIVQSSPREQLQPKLVEFDYLKPGDRIARPRPRLFAIDAKSGAAEPVAIDDSLFPAPWRLSDWAVSPDGKELRFLHNHRGHRVMQVQALEFATGKVRNIVDERPETFFDYAHKRYLRWLEADDSLIWMSERSGFNHLYRIDAATGAVKHPITEGDWPVFRVLDFDRERGELLFTAGGVYPDQDPYHVHFGRVSIDGGDITWLTEGDGTHEIEFSPGGNGDYYVDRYSRVDLPPVAELRRTSDGSRIAELQRADDTELRANGWRPPQRFVAKGRDGKTDIYGWVVRPIDYDANARYPVLENIYAGPHGAHVPKRFAVHRSEMELAEYGFVVVRIDGMGTSKRSKAFHDVAWKNLGDAGFPDRIAWMRALAATDPSIDISRVGIFGGSAGGQNAMRALIAHGDFYDAAAADCGCHDNRMDKIWWNELWMSWPLGPHYEEASNVVQAHRMQGNLLLTVGELDRNVDPASTMQVVDALIRADKDFELIVFPGGGHGAGSSSYGVRRRRDFFVRCLANR